MSDPQGQNIAAEVAGRVRAALAENDRTQAYLSRSTGIPITTLKRKLDGLADFTLRDIDRIARALKCPPKTLIPDAFRSEQDVA
jgi:transcriptional regulator with XRE-family HTH domain